MTQNNPLVLRMDDVGASSKKFNVYSKSRIGNFLFLKRIKPFKAWGPYDEISVEQWKKIIDLLNIYNFKLTIAVTASWVDEKNNLIPFPEKFPQQANLLKEAFKNGIIEITNHGLTHCVVGNHLPRYFTSVRKYHREFWDWIPDDTQKMHLEKSTKILHEWLGNKIDIFVPPGNVYSKYTIEVLNELNFSRINSSKKLDCNYENLKMIDEKNVFAFHDKDISTLGIDWFKNQLERFKINYTASFLKEL